MALKKLFSYQWQLFVPLVISLWTIIIGMSLWHYRTTRDDKLELIHSQLDLINARIVMAYKYDLDPKPFIDFVWRYYRDNPTYDLVRVSVYMDGVLTHACGEPIKLPEQKISETSGITTDTRYHTDGIGSAVNPDDCFYYAVSSSHDGRMVVYTVLPYDSDIIAAAMPDSKVLYIMVILGIAATILAYFSTRHFSRNIKILRTLAQRASTDPDFIPPMNYPHDELGDISRQIVTIYNQRSKAVLKLQQEHEVALHAIEEKARAKRQLTNNINHELRTPIGVIKGYLDTIVENPDMDDESRIRFITKALEHVNRLVNLIADVSAITRLDEGGELINTEEVDFHDIAYTLANDFETSGALGSMEFRHAIPFDCKILGNYNLITGAIINLAKNAAAYSKGTVCELILVGEDEKFYRFVFRDNGIGVGEEHLPHLFERFYRIDSGRSRKAGGTGLGLPIVESTILAHGGTINAANRPGGGLEFHFTLPKFRPGKIM